MPTTMTPVALALIPALLRERGLEVGRKKLGQAVASGAVPAFREGGRLLLTPEGVDAAERHFRGLAALGHTKGGAAALERAMRARQNLAAPR